MVSYCVRDRCRHLARCRIFKLSLALACDMPAYFPFTLITFHPFFPYQLNLYSSSWISYSCILISPLFLARAHPPHASVKRFAFEPSLNYARSACFTLLSSYVFFPLRHALVDHTIVQMLPYVFRPLSSIRNAAPSFLLLFLVCIQSCIIVFASSSSSSTFALCFHSPVASFQSSFGQERRHLPRILMRGHSSFNLKKTTFILTSRCNIIL